MPYVFDSARFLCVEIICQFYDPKSGSVLMGRLLRFHGEMPFAFFCPILSVGNAVHRSKRKAFDRAQHQAHGGKDVVSLCICVFVFFGPSLADLVLLKVPEHGAVFDHGLLTYQMHRCTAVVPFLLKFQSVNISSVQRRCKVVAQASGFCGPRTNSL